ncbi:MAG: hypothetical protein DIU72_001420 [Pseudomonadota bacterium]|nr:MAG: hypothetical protein DIU72_08150 [Pseudomonadota bacterium]
MKLGILAALAAFHLFPASEEPSAQAASEAPARPASASIDRALDLAASEEGEPRGERIGIDTPVGRVEVMVLWSEAQLQLGLLEEPCDQAVVAYAPAGVFVRKERPTGRLVLSVPILRF